MTTRTTTYTCHGVIGAADETPYEAITQGSFLVCKHCDVIEPLTSGQPELDRVMLEEVYDSLSDEEFLDIDYNNLTPEQQELYNEQLEKRKDTLSPELQNQFPLIVDKNGNNAYGGNQDWFQDAVQKNGGCGPTASTNILAYMALNDPDIALGLGVDPATLLTQAGYTNFMNLVYQTVRPYEIDNIIDAIKGIVPQLSDIIDNSGVPLTLGIWPVGPLADKTVQFAVQNGVALKYSSLTNGDIKNGIPVLGSIGYKEGQMFILSALASDHPVALLNTFNSTAMNPSGNNSSSPQSTQQHWVTITGCEKIGGDMLLTISSWGEEWVISYNELYESWQNPSAIGSGMVYFELGEDK